MKNEIEFKFGDYATIEQKRHGVPNEMFVHKVVGQLRSNTWVDVPVRVPATETLHGEMEDICLCICCGIDETEVRRYRVKDMRRHSPVSLVADEKRGSTITLQAVNELITSLESAGELSIREQKFLKLAKAFKQLAAENAYLLNGAASELNTSWMFHKTMLGAQAALVCLALGRESAAREWLEGTTDEAGAEIPDDITVDGLQAWFDSQMVSNDGKSGFLTRAEAEEAIRNACPATDRIYAEAEARGVEKAIAHLEKKFSNIGVQIMNLQWLADSLRKGASE
ncbi:hypothetical protein WAT03_002105 [Klebsiella pneumoniae]